MKASKLSKTKKVTEQLSFWEHVSALRATFIKIALSIFGGFVVAFIFHTPLIAFLLHPLTSLSTAIVLGPLEGIKVALSVSFWSAVVLSSPLWIFFLLQFLLPALHSNERKLLLPFTFLAFFLMLAGLYVAFFFSLPLITQYLITFNSSIGTNFWTLTHTLNFILWVIVVHVFCCELFLILITLVHFRIINNALLKKARPYVIVSIFLFSALLTPPDVVTQLFLALPLTILYEASYLYSKFRLKPVDRCKQT